MQSQKIIVYLIHIITSVGKQLFVPCVQQKQAT